MEKDILLLYNPKAGDTFFRFELENFLNVFGKSGTIIRIFTSQYEGDMAKCIENTNLEEIELVVVAGGDGSVNEVIQTMMKMKHRPKIGIIPAGTRNSIAKYLEMPDTYIQCMEVIYRGITEEINVGEVDGKFFLNTCGFGNMMDVYQKTSQEMKNTFGKLAYVVNVIYHMPKETPFRVKVEANGEVYEEELILFIVINADGFRIRKAAEYDQEEKRSLRFIGIRNKGKFTNRRNMIRSLWKIPKVGDNVLSIVSDDMVVSCDQLPEGGQTCFVDGEPGCEFPLHFSLHRDALQIVTNRNVPRGTFTGYEDNRSADSINPINENDEKTVQKSEESEKTVETKASDRSDTTGVRETAAAVTATDNAATTNADATTASAGLSEPIESSPEKKDEKQTSVSDTSSEIGIVNSEKMEELNTESIGSASENAEDKIAASNQEQ